MRQQADPRAIDALEQNIAAVGERVARTEEQLRHIETMEQAIRQLYGSLEQSRDADEPDRRGGGEPQRWSACCHRATPGGRSPELKALEEDCAPCARVRRVPSAATRKRSPPCTRRCPRSWRRSRSSRPRRAAAGDASSCRRRASSRRNLPLRRPPQQPRPLPGSAHAARQPAPAAASGAAPLSAGDDFIAAARRAAQAAAIAALRLRAEFGPIGRSARGRGRLSLLSRFRKPRKPMQPASPAPIRWRKAADGPAQRAAGGGGCCWRASCCSRRSRPSPSTCWSEAGPARAAKRHRGTGPAGSSRDTAARAAGPHRPAVRSHRHRRASRPAAGEPRQAAAARDRNAGAAQRRGRRRCQRPSSSSPAAISMARAWRQDRRQGRLLV